MHLRSAQSPPDTTELELYLNVQRLFSPGRDSGIRNIMEMLGNWKE